MPSQPPLESWKRSPPADRDEAEAAELIQKLGAAEKLSPQAMNRVAHRLRPPGKRLPLFADARFAIAAVGGVLSFVAIAFIGIRFTGLEDHPSASALRADQAIARNDAPAAPPSVDAQSEDAAPPTRAKKAREPAAMLAAKAAPKPSQDGLVARREVAAPAAADRAEAQGAPMAPSAASAAAPAERRALAADARSPSGPPSGSVDRCRAQLPGFDATLSRSSGDIEGALFGRGSCRLTLGQREAGFADLRSYLSRFPEGRFAARARQLLADALK